MNQLMDSPGARSRIVIVGAGYAGYHCARHLERLLPCKADASTRAARSCCGEILTLRRNATCLRLARRPRECGHPLALTHAARRLLERARRSAHYER